MKKLRLKNLGSTYSLSNQEKKEILGGNATIDCNYAICNCLTGSYATSCDDGCPADCWMGPPDPICWELGWCM